MMGGRVERLIEEGCASEMIWYEENMEGHC